MFRNSHLEFRISAFFPEVCREVQILLMKVNQTLIQSARSPPPVDKPGVDYELPTINPEEVVAEVLEWEIVD